MARSKLFFFVDNFVLRAKLSVIKKKKNYRSSFTLCPKIIFKETLITSSTVITFLLRYCVIQLITEET